MGKMIEGTIPTLFGGVSRQPPQVRQPNQVQEAKNALLSVETGGFEKRPATQFVADLSFLDNTKEYAVHPIDRTETEQDFLLIDSTTPAIFAVNAITGAQKTVNIGDTIRYFEIETTGIDSIALSPTGAIQIAHSDTQFDWDFKLTDAATVFKLEGSADNAVWNDIATGKTGASGTFSTTVDAVATGDHNYIRVSITTAAGTAADTITLKATFADLTYLLNANPEDFRVTSIADFTFLVNRNVTARLAEADSGAITSTVQQFSDLPAATGSGNIHRVRGKDTDGFGSYYVKDNGSGDWIEIVDPTAHNNFDSASMPHQIVRAAGGASYTLNGATWDARPSGDETLNPAPGYINGSLGDVGFYRNRLVLISDETVYLSQSGDVFNMWASKATDVLDSDPIERAASTTNVNILQFVQTFRKLLFCTSARAQFELESGNNPLTPETALMNQATSYQASLISKPQSMGDVLHFGAKTEGSAVVYEYFFQDTSLSNTGLDITRHIRTYIDNDVYQLASDPTSTTMYLLTTAAQNKLYIYRTFFDEQKKLQSAWGEYIFGAAEANAFIHGFAVFSNFVVMIIERDDGNIYLEQFPVEREASITDMPFTPQIDQRDELTGTYDSGTNLTTWTTTWDHDDDAKVVLGPSGAIPGRTLLVSYPTATTITAVGDHSAADAYVGRTYEMDVELSRIWPRENDVPIVTGRMTLTDMTLLYEKTGYFDLVIQANGDRGEKKYTFEGKVLGDAETVIDAPTIHEVGAFGHKKVDARSDTVQINIKNNTPEPSVITSVQWRGFFNEIGRAG